jgi:hypothetical protein
VFVLRLERHDQRRKYRGSSWESAGAWVGILLAAAGEEVTAEMDVNPLPLPQMTADGELLVAGTLAESLLVPTMEAEGIATPPEGTLDVMFLPTVEMAGQHDAAGSLEVIVGPTVEVVAETRFFGVRVITPPAESRTVRPRLGASD